MAYLGKTPSQAVRSRYYYTATGGETSLSGADDNANTLTFTDGNYVDVALNGVTLVAGTDYNTTTANTIGGLTALVASDVVEVIVYDTFSVFGGNVNGDFTVGGTLTAANITNTGNLNFGDNDKAIFGAGSDLQIYHDASDSYIVDGGTGNLRLQGQDIYLMNAAGTEVKIRADDDSFVKLYFDNAEKFATTATGVDVTGTVTADGLTVDGATTVNNADLLLNGGSPEIIFQTGASHYNWMVAAQENVSNALEISSGSQDGDYSNDTWTPRLVVTSGGSVGIGTTSPDTDISKFGGSARGLSVAAGQPAITVRATANSQYVGYFGQASTNTYLGAMGGGSLIIQTGTSGTERMRLDSSGNLLVGQSTTALPGLGNTTTGISLAGQYDIIAASRTSGAALILNRNTDDGDLMQFSRDGTTVGEIGVSGGNNIYISGQAAAHSGLTFATNQILPTAQGSITDGAESLGSSSNRFSDLYLSGGVVFGTGGPSPITSNTLDDYEEGTWTPTIKEASRATSVTYQPWSSASYTKVGNTVFAIIELGISNHDGTTSAAAWTFSGFPISVSSARGGYSIYNNNSGSIIGGGRFDSGSYNAYFYGSVPTSCALYVSFVYQSNA